MTKVLRTATILLVLRAAHSYILLTANIEDVQNVAKRLVQSPIGGQVGSIVRRAYSVFNNHLGQARANMRADDGDIILSYNPGERPNQYFRRNNEKEGEMNVINGDTNGQPDVTSGHNEGRDEGTRNKDEGTNQKPGDPEEFSALGKSASVYLHKIKKIFENAP